MYFLEEKRCCHYSMRRGSSASCWGSKQSFTRVCCTSSSKTLPSAPHSPCHTHMHTHMRTSCFSPAASASNLCKKKKRGIWFTGKGVFWLLGENFLAVAPLFLSLGHRGTESSLYYLAFLHCAHITISLSTRPVLFIFTAVTPAIITSFHLVFEFRTHTFLKLTWTRILKMRLKKLRCCRGLWWCDWKFDFGCKSYLTMVRPKVIKQRNQMRQIKDVASKHRWERETRWNLKAYSKISHFLTCGFLIQMFSSSCHDMNSLRSVPVIQCS